MEIDCPETRQAVLEDFAAHRAAFLKRLRDQFPIEYARLVAQAMLEAAEAEDGDEDDDDDYDDDEDAGEDAREIRFEEWRAERRASVYFSAQQMIKAEDDPMRGLLKLQLVLLGVCLEDDNGMAHLARINERWPTPP